MWLGKRLLGASVVAQWVKPLLMMHLFESQLLCFLSIFLLMCLGKQKMAQVLGLLSFT